MTRRKKIVARAVMVWEVSCPACGDLIQLRGSRPDTLSVYHCECGHEFRLEGVVG